MLPDPALAAYKLVPPVTSFALAAAGINNTAVGIRTGRGDYVWKTYQTHADRQTLCSEHRLVSWLATQELSFAVPAPVPSDMGDTLCLTPDGYKALFPLLHGHRPDHCDPRQMQAVGAALGELHATLRCLPPGLAPDLAGYAQLGKIHPLMTDPAALTPSQLGLAGTRTETELCAWLRGELGLLDAFLATSYRALPQQVIHGDFGPGNTLYADGKVTAVLDFEMATCDARGIDLASGLKFSMRLWERSNPWVIGANFCHGYNRWARPGEAEIAAIGWLMRLYDAVSIIWWLGRDRASGLSPRLERIQALRDFTRWLEVHGTQLQDMLARAAYKGVSETDE